VHAFCNRTYTTRNCHVKISGLTALLYLPLLGEPGGWDKSAARRSYVAQT
jgi:hypothetical protein